MEDSDEDYEEMEDDYIYNENCRRDRKTFQYGRK